MSRVRTPSPFVPIAIVACMALSASAGVALLGQTAGGAAPTEQQALSWAKERGIVGQDASPEGAVARGEFAVILAKTLGLPTDPTGHAPYDDVAADAWFAGSVNRMTDAGYVTGEGGRYKPQDPVTIGAVVVALQRAYGLETKLPVAPGSPAYLEAAMAARENGILLPGFTRPDQKVQRRQLALMLLLLARRDEQAVMHGAAGAQEADGGTPTAQEYSGPQAYGGGSTGAYPGGGASQGYGPQYGGGTQAQGYGATSQGYGTQQYGGAQRPAAGGEAQRLSPEQVQALQDAQNQFVLLQMQNIQRANQNAQGPLRAQRGLDPSLRTTDPQPEEGAGGSGSSEAASSAAGSSEGSAASAASSASAGGGSAGTSRGQTPGASSRAPEPQASSAARSLDPALWGIGGEDPPPAPPRSITLGTLGLSPYNSWGGWGPVEDVSHNGMLLTFRGGNRQGFYDRATNTITDMPYDDILRLSEDGKAALVRGNVVRYDGKTVKGIAVLHFPSKATQALLFHQADGEISADMGTYAYVHKGKLRIIDRRTCTNAAVADARSVTRLSDDGATVTYVDAAGNASLYDRAAGSTSPAPSEPWRGAQPPEVPGTTQYGGFDSADGRTEGYALARQETGKGWTEYKPYVFSRTDGTSDDLLAGTPYDGRKAGFLGLYSQHPNGISAQGRYVLLDVLTRRIFSENDVRWIGTSLRLDRKTRVFTGTNSYGGPTHFSGDGNTMIQGIRVGVFPDSEPDKAATPSIAPTSCAPADQAFPFAEGGPLPDMPPARDSEIARTAHRGFGDVSAHMSPDGRYLVFYEQNDGSTTFHVDRETGAVTALPRITREVLGQEPYGNENPHPRVTADGNVVLLSLGGKALEYDLRTERYRVLGAASTGIVDATPDGARILVPQGVIDRAAARETRFPQQPSGTFLFPLAISDDGRRVAVRRFTNTGAPEYSYEIRDLASGEVTPVTTIPPDAGERRLFALYWSGDLRTAAFSVIERESPRAYGSYVIDDIASGTPRALPDPAQPYLHDLILRGMSDDASTVYLKAAAEESFGDAALLLRYHRPTDTYRTLDSGGWIDMNGYAFSGDGRSWVRSVGNSGAPYPNGTFPLRAGTIQ